MVSLDGDARVLEIGRAKATKADVNVALDYGMSFELPYSNASFDRVLSSLLFHHLTRENKACTSREIFRVLRPEGELHIADFEEPSNALMYFVSLLMRRLEEASDNIKGLLPEMLRDAGFEQVQETARYMTIFGTLSLYTARKPK